MGTHDQGGNPPLTQAEVNALAGEADVTLAAFLPLLPPHQRQQIATGIVGDVVKLQGWLGQAAAGEFALWGISLRKKNLVQLAGLGDNTTQPFGFKVTGNPREIANENDMVMYATVLALATSSPARAMIAALGYELRFVMERKVEKRGD